MIAREALLAGVLAATDKVVQHANAGEWQAAHKISADRRVLLEQLASQEPQANEHGFVRALREAAAESDAALALMSQSAVSKPANAANAGANLGAAHTDMKGGRLCTKA